MTTYTFKKMHGLGNDFVLIDQRENPLLLSKERIKRMGDRRFGIGFDQLITLEDPNDNNADVFMRIYNADGLEAGACGNATRCVGYLIAHELQKEKCLIQTISGILSTEIQENQQVTVDMGQVSTVWNKIPLSHEMDTLELPIQQGVLKKPTATSVGNPHMTFFVENVEGIDLFHLGQCLTKHQYYPEDTNVEIVEILDEHTIKVKVYERGVGITPACGTGACASVAAGIRRKLISSPVKVLLDGGTLNIVYDETLKMTGPVAFSYDGTFTQQLFDDV